jgi:hypothetical protein
MLRLSNDKGEERRNCHEVYRFMQLLLAERKRKGTEGF